MTHSSRALLLVLAATAAGCSTYRTRELDYRRTASSFLGAASEKGLTLSAEAMTDPDRAARYLWFSPAHHGYLPVVVRAKNPGPNAFRVERTGVQCVLRDGTALECAPVAEVASELSYGVPGSLPYWVFGLVPGVVSLVHRSLVNQDLSADYEEKHLFGKGDALRIGVEDRLVGVVFFRLKRSGVVPSMAEAVLEVKVTKERGPEGGDIETLTLRPQVE
ncbi:MAG: hypothetical protein L0216_10120 [Planctomycetales bacterium]|nr:hypothetical protein [Planctomycetales bacterium]